MARPLCFLRQQPPHVCLCGSGELPGVEPRLWGDDCYSTGVGFKNAFLMGGMRFTGESCELRESQTTRRRWRGGGRRSISGNSLPSAGGRMNSRAAQRKSDVCIFTDSFGKRRSCRSSSNEKKYLKASLHNASNEPKMYVYFLFYLFVFFEGVTCNLNNWVKSTCHASPPRLPLRSLSTHTCKQTRCTCRRPCNCGCKVA